MTQPPSGGCVLKQRQGLDGLRLCRQPPSGGCVLKLKLGDKLGAFVDPAAFGRLCVETRIKEV